MSGVVSAPATPAAPRNPVTSTAIPPTSPRMTSSARMARVPWRVTSTGGRAMGAAVPCSSSFVLIHVVVVVQLGCGRGCRSGQWSGPELPDGCLLSFTLSPDGQDDDRKGEDDQKGEQRYPWLAQIAAYQGGGFGGCVDDLADLEAWVAGLPNRSRSRRRRVPLAPDARAIEAGVEPAAPDVTCFPAGGGTGRCSGAVPMGGNGGGDESPPRFPLKVGLLQFEALSC